MPKHPSFLKMKALTNDPSKLRAGASILASVLALAAALALAPQAIGADDAATSTKDEAFELRIDPTQIDREGPLPRSFAPILGEARSAVVSVYTARIVRVYRGGGNSQQDFLRRFFGLPPAEDQPSASVEERKMPQGMGSGVIVSENGYILTNNHVVSDERGRDADEVLVQLSDGREIPAKIVGRDSRSDIALLKIEADKLTPITIADSDQIEVGDRVFAIGNPLGVGVTVTQGIVSATGRTIGIYGQGGYEDFIQTDASINPGNSGGALVDIDGRLIGINSAILSQSGGNIGIGFAIPTNLAVNIATQIASSGEVRRGYIGVYTSDVTPEIAEAFGLPKASGVLIDKVEEGLPAEQAGIQRGDVIVAIDGKETENANDLRLQIGQTPPGSEIEVTYIRDGERKSVSLKVTDPEEGAFGSGELTSGVEIAVISEELRERYQIPSEIEGVIITSVDPRSSLARHVRPGMVILEINDQTVDSVPDARRALRNGVNKIYVFDRGRIGYLALRVR